MTVFSRTRRPAGRGSRRWQIVLLALLVSLAVFLWTTPLRQERALRNASLAQLQAHARRQPSNARVFYYLGLRERQAGNREAALQAFIRAAERNPGNEATWLAAAAAAGEVKGEQAEFDLLKTFLQQSPDSARAHLAIARLYQRNRAYQRAYEEASLAAQADPRNAQAWRLAAAAAAAMGKMTEADAAMRRAVDLAPGNWENQSGMGDILAERNRHAAALPFYREAVRLAPREPVPHLSLGRSLFKSSPSAIPAARESLLRSVALRPDIPVAHLLIGQTYAREKRWAEARKSLEQSKRLDAANPDVYFELARVYGHLGDMGAAAREAKTHRQITQYWEKRRVLFERIAQAKSGEQADTLRRELARLLAAHGDYAGAERQLRQVLARSPDDTAAARELALLERQRSAVAASEAPAVSTPSPPGTDAEALRAADDLLAKKQHAKAASLYLSLLKRDKKNARAFQGLGLALQAQGKQEDASVCFLEATRLNPRLAPSQFALGRVFYEVGLVKEATRRLRQAVREAPDNAAAWHALGLALRDSTLTAAEAEDAFRRANALDDRSSVYLLDLAEMQANRQKLSEAEASYRRALTLAPGDGAVLSRFGAFLTEGKPTEARRQEAERLLKAAVAADPGDDFARYNLGRLSLERGDTRQAVAYLEDVLKRAENADEKDVWYLLSRAYRRLGDSARADKAMVVSRKLQEDFLTYTQAQEQVQLHPERAGLRLKLARLYVQRGENARAISEYRRCVRLEPANTAARAELKALENRLKRIGKMPSMTLFNAMVASSSASPSKSHRE